MESKTLKSTKHSAGRYEITFMGRFFTVMSSAAREEAGSLWVLFETDANFAAGINSDGYWNHFCTKADAIQGIVEGCEAE